MSQLWAVRIFLSLTSVIWSTGSVFAQGATHSQSVESGQHDVLLLLPSGPLHIQLHITSNGTTLKEARAEYLARLITKLDVDSDGKLSRQETAKHPLFVTGRRFENNSFLNSLRESKDYTNDQISMAIDRAAGQLVTYRQNDSLADQDLSVFNILDSDKSGLIDAVEMRMSPARIASRDSDHDQCITFDEFLSDAMVAPNQAILNLSTEPPAALHSEILRNASEPLMPSRLIRRYDSDKDAHLSSAELGWDDDRFAKLDKDHNKLLSVQELAALPKAQPDVTLKIDMTAQASKAMQILDAEKSEFESLRDDLVRISRDSITVSVGYRARDPLAEEEGSARRTFNAIDIDANGYLDRKEIEGHQRFELYLFDAMDQNNDDRVFADELLKYVREYTEPASTTCQVTLFDTGNGFFQVLDVNGDGRVSIRELRKSEAQLKSLAGNQPEINPSRVAKSYRIEVQRGGIGLFGRVDRPAEELPVTLLKPTDGPN